MACFIDVTNNEIMKCFNDSKTLKIFFKLMKWPILILQKDEKKCTFGIISESLRYSTAYNNKSQEMRKSINGKCIVIMKIKITLF